jgi:hypothetical protein
VNRLPAIHFNILVDNTLFVSYNQWAAICDTLSTIKFPSPLYGTGSVRSDFNCQTCHAIDHPTGKCPFPNIPGWKGPQGIRRCPQQRYNQSAGIGNGNYGSTPDDANTPQGFSAFNGQPGNSSRGRGTWNSGRGGFRGANFRF